MYRVMRFSSSQKGITGLETAIILIAFVMVASVFAYVVLTAGLFSSQKAKDAVYSGLEEVRSTVELKGNVLLDLKEKKLMFTLGSSASGEPIDFTDTSEGKNVVVISYSDTSQIISNVDWTLTKLTSQNDDNMLETNELFLITVDLSEVDDLGPYDKFTIEVKPPKGAVLTIERTIPPRVDELVNLH